MLEMQRGTGKICKYSIMWGAKNELQFEGWSM